MNALTIILGVLAVVSDAIRDEITFHWDRLFVHWFPTGKDQWTNPSISWKNKYTNNWFTTKLLSGPLVMFTDLWHLLKFIMLNSFFGAALSAIDLHHWGWLEYTGMMIALNIAWGFVFEFMGGVMGTLSDRYIK